jgi:hypothetical protein
VSHRSRPLSSPMRTWAQPADLMRTALTQDIPERLWLNVYDSPIGCHFRITDTGQRILWPRVASVDGTRISKSADTGHLYYSAESWPQGWM